MIDAYASDIDFANVMSALAIGKTQDPYMLKDGFLLYESALMRNSSFARESDE